MVGRGILSQKNYEVLASRLHDRLKELHLDLDKMAADHEDAVAEELRSAGERLLHAEKDGVKDAYLAGIISERVFKRLLSRVDERLHDLATVPHKGGALDEINNDNRNGQT